MKPCKTPGEYSGFSTTLLTAEEFSRFGETWNNLLDSSRSESFFLKWEWIYTFWESIDRQDKVLQVWLCHDGDELVGIAPLYAYSSIFMKLPVRKIAFLGDRVASDYMDIIAEPGYEEICCREVLHRLRDENPPAYDLIELDGVCTDSNLYRYLATGCDSGTGVLLFPRFSCPRTMLDKSFDKYISGLSASTRYSLGRKQRKYEKDFGAMAIEHPDLKDKPQMLGVLFDLHRKRWDVLEDRASTFSNAYRESFNTKLLHRLDEGGGYFSCMTIDDEPASILYIFTYKGNAFFYQNGWDPVYASYGIGILHIHQAVRHAIEAGYKSFDFLRGDEAYKYKFCEEARQAYCILYFGCGPYARLAKTLFRLKTGLKNLIFGLRKLRSRVNRPGEHFICSLQDRFN